MPAHAARAAAASILHDRVDLGPRVGRPHDLQRRQGRRDQPGARRWRSSSRRDNIRVNSVAPGSILFPGGSWHKRQQADPEGIADFVARELPFGRFGRADEVGDVVAFLASPRASWISGACVPVDGCQCAVEHLNRESNRRLRRDSRLRLDPDCPCRPVQPRPTALFMPWIVVAAVRHGALPHDPASVRAGAPVRRRPARRWSRRQTRRGRRADAVPGVHDGARGVDRHGQHRRRRRRPSSPAGPARCSGSGCYGFVATAIKFAEAVLGVQFRESRTADDAVGTDVLPARRPEVAGARRGSTRSSPAWPRSRRRRSRSRTRLRSCSTVAARRRRRGCRASSIAVLTWLVIIGGIKSIGRAAEKLSPLKVGLYLAGGLIVIVDVRGADSRRARARRSRGVLDCRRVGSGAAWACSSPCATGWRAASTRTKPATAPPRSRMARRSSRSPSQQGLNAVMEVFIVSFVTSTISALTILC